MSEKIRLAMQASADNPHALQPLMSENPDAFVRQLCDPDFLSREMSIELARRIAQFEPELDIRLVQLLPGRDSVALNPISSGAVERALEVLDAISAGARILPPLTRLMRDPSPRLRAKTALIIGRRLQNTQMVAACMRHEDPRVRANTVESLWGGKASSVSEVLWSAVKDVNNRVVGNALLGLYRLQDWSMVGHLLAMAVDTRPAFRATAAWTMGQTSDPRFLPALEKLARDLYASVRKAASAALERVRARSTGGVHLQLSVLRKETAPKGVCSVNIQALGPEGLPKRGLVPLQFILWEDGKLITDYQAIELNTSDALIVGFVLCREQGICGETLKIAEGAVLGCLDLKSPEDQWALARLVSTREQPSSPVPEPGRPGRRIEPATYLREAGEVRKSSAKPPVETQFVSATLAAFGSLLPGMVKLSGKRHLILLASSEFVPPAEMEEQADEAAGKSVTIHAVVVGSPHGSLTALCQRTGGMIMEAAGAAEVAAAFRKIYLALTHCYQIQFRPAPAELASAWKLEISCDGDRGECRL